MREIVSRIAVLRAYLGSLKRYLVLGCAVYTASAVFGWYFAYSSPERAGEIFEALRESFAEKFLRLEPREMALGIFLNNAIASAIVAFLGIFFGLPSAFGVGGNGFVLGLVTFAGAGKDFWLISAATLPHGIVELPAFLLSVAIGFRLGGEALKKLLGREANLTREIKNGLEFYLAIVVPLLLIAAIIEAFVSLRIVKSLG